MSPPEVWGPAVWTLFHTLCEKINDDAYPIVVNSMFNIIVRICNYLPCPECSKDASNFLAKITLSSFKTKEEFKNLFYLFHNWVNVKKRKQLYNYANMNKYSQTNLIVVVNDFIKHYNTRGNMNLLTESFHRSFVIKEFLKWIRYYSRAFVNKSLSNINTIHYKSTTEEPIVENNNNEEVSPLIEESVADESVVDEIDSVVEENELIVKETIDEGSIMK